MKRGILISLIAVVSCGLIATAAVAGTLVPSTVTIKGDNGDLHGKVKSQKGKCLAGRTVVVFKKTGGGKQKIGSDTSERQGDVGVWSIGNSGFKHGKFFAKLQKSEICSGDRSKTIEI